jgi:DNA polymerase-4
LEKRLKERGILYLGDVKKHKNWFFSWGKSGVMLFNRINGIDNEEVKEKENRKSIGISRRFDPVFDRREIIRRIHILCRYLFFLIKQKHLNPTFYYLKIKYKAKKSSKAHMRVNRICNELLLKKIMNILFYRADCEDDFIISISLSVSKFKYESNLFDYEEDKKLEKLSDALYEIRSRFGVSSIVGADEMI